MNVAIFGGTFDPIHRGHLAIARAARKQFKLGRIYFVPADIPPHKQRRPITPFFHRYAMVALATQEEEGFVPSLLEAPGDEVVRPPSYSIKTVRRLRALLPKRDKLFFLIGIDAFLDVGKWYRSEELLREVEFIVASRPGFSLPDILEALPRGLRVAARGPKKIKTQVVVGRVKIHLLPGIKEPASATAIRTAAAQGRSIARLVPHPVAEYIIKMRLYR